jgi:adenylate cyclase class 2
VLLRLRQVDRDTVLTLKLPVAGEHRHKVREEHETHVAEPAALRAILRGLGFEVCYRYQKHRTVYRLGDLALCLDETPIGCFVELEGPPAEIDLAAARLGAAPADYVRETYRELQERFARERGVAAGDLLLGAGGVDGR